MRVNEREGLLPLPYPPEGKISLKFVNPGREGLTTPTQENSIKAYETVSEVNGLMMVNQKAVNPLQIPLMNGLFDSSLNIINPYQIVNPREAT